MIPQTHDRVSEAECRAFRDAAELTGKKWSAAILLAIQMGAERFSDIRAAVDGLSDRLLSVRLRELETHELITRSVLPTVPASVRYELTPAGDELVRIMQPLVQWSHRWQSDSAPEAVNAHR